MSNLLGAGAAPFGNKTKSILTLALLAAVFLAAAVPARAEFINGSFEDGLSGWTATTPLNGYVEVRNSVALGDGWEPTDGAYFAVLVTGGGAGVYTTLQSQQFNVNEGDILSFDVFFQTTDYLNYNDNGFVALINTGNSEKIELYSISVEIVGNQGSDGWRTESYIFQEAGTFHLLAGVRNQLDNRRDSILGLDNIQLTSAHPIPEPSSLLLGTIGMLGLATGAVRRWRRGNPSRIERQAANSG